MDDQHPGAHLAEPLRSGAALRHAQKHALAGRAQREDAVDPAVDQKPHQRLDRLLVQPGAAVAKRRHRGGQEQGGHLGCDPRRVDSSAVPVGSGREHPAPHRGAGGDRWGDRRRRDRVLRRPRRDPPGADRGATGALHAHDPRLDRRLPASVLDRGGAAAGRGIGVAVSELHRGHRPEPLRRRHPRPGLPVADHVGRARRRAARAGAAPARVGGDRRRAALRRRGAAAVPVRRPRGRPGPVPRRRRVHRHPGRHDGSRRGVGSDGRHRVQSRGLRDLRRAAAGRAHLARPDRGRAGRDRLRAAVRRRGRVGRPAAADRDRAPAQAGDARRAPGAGRRTDDDRRGHRAPTGGRRCGERGCSSPIRPPGRPIRPTRSPATPGSRSSCSTRPAPPRSRARRRSGARCGSGMPRTGWCRPGSTR